MALVEAKPGVRAGQPLVELENNYLTFNSGSLVLSSIALWCGSKYKRKRY